MKIGSLTLIIFMCSFFLLTIGCSPVQKVGEEKYKVLGIPFQRLDGDLGSSDTYIPVNSLQRNIYQSIANSQKSIYMRNFPRLNLSHDPLKPNTLLKLLKDAADRGVEIKILHDTREQRSQLVDYLYREGVATVSFNPAGWSSHRLGKNPKYIIFDNQIISIKDRYDSLPRYIANNDTDKYNEDWSKAWDFSQEQYKQESFKSATK